MNKKTITNYIYDLSYQLFVIITPLITTPYTSRVLQPEGIGQYSYTTSVASMFTLFAALGINMYGQREIAYHRKDIYQKSKIFWELVISRVITTTVVTTIYLLFCLWYKEYFLLLMLQVFSILAVMFDISWYFQGIEEFKLLAIKNFVIKIVSIVLVFAFIKGPEDLALYVFILSFTTLISNSIFIFNLKGELVRVPIKELHLKRHLRGTLEFFLPAIAVQIYSQVDKIMLGVIAKDNLENGYYEQARKIVNLVIKVITSITTVMYPKIAVLFSEHKTDEIRKALQSTYRLIMMMLIPIVIGLWFISDNFVEWFFGPGYEPVAILIKLSGVLLTFMGIGNFAAMLYLNPTGQQNKGTLIYVISAAINLALNSFMIIKFQSVGAILASIMAEAFSCLAQFYLLQKSSYKFDPIYNLWKYIVAGALMAIGLWGVQLITPYGGITETMIEIVIAILIYGLTLFALKEDHIMLVFDKFNSKIVGNGP